MSSSSGRLLVDEPAPGIARLTISNPARRGALDRSILDGLVAELASLREARCVILTGEGSVFSAGYDIGDLSRDLSRERPEADADALVANPFEAALAALDAHPGPTLAALNGHAIGGGLELALACDLRVAAENARFGMPPARIGLVYSHTGIRRFIDAIGASRTRELFLVAGRIDAATALGWGLVNAVHPAAQLAGAALALAGEMARNAPLAQRGNKRVIEALLDGHGSLTADVQRELLALRHASLRSDDFREGLRAFADKRDPEWRGR
ncbi:MAG: enoyl-CoA hydratase/isomerase family protein [Solirubrobacteraceae bacterium]